MQPESPCPPPWPPSWRWPCRRAGASRPSTARSTRPRSRGAPASRPPTITVDKRNRVELKVGNTSDKTHGFSIEGYGVQEEVEAGEPIEVKFIANDAGTYKVYCQLHPAHQTATLIVR